VDEGTRLRISPPFFRRENSGVLPPPRTPNSSSGQRWQSRTPSRGSGIGSAHSSAPSTPLGQQQRGATPVGGKSARFQYTTTLGLGGSKSRQVAVETDQQTRPQSRVGTPGGAPLTSILKKTRSSHRESARWDSLEFDGEDGSDADRGYSSRGGGTGYGSRGPSRVGGESESEREEGGGRWGGRGDDGEAIKEQVSALNSKTLEPGPLNPGHFPRSWSTLNL
jgi:hypothetical protein